MTMYSLPQCKISYKGQEFTATIKDIHVDGSRVKANIQVDDYRPFFEYYFGAGAGTTNSAWVNFDFLKFEQPTTPQDIINQLEVIEYHEYFVEMMERAR